MKVEYKTIIRTAPSPDMRDNTTRQIFQTTPCCKEMAHAWGEAIDFGDHPKGPPVPGAEVSIYSADGGWDEIGEVIYTDYPISFCPFCGAKIETVEVERVRLVARKRTVEKEEVTWEPWEGFENPTPGS